MILEALQPCTYNYAGLGQYDGLGQYCGLSTASEMFLIFTTQLYHI